MTPEERALLENTHTLVKENNEMLRGIQRRGRISFFWRVGYWVVIIGLSLGAFHFLQNYLDVLTGIGGGTNLGQQIRDITE